MHALLGGTARIGVAGRRCGDELIDLEVEFFSGCCRVEENFLVAVLAAALDGFVAATTGDDAEREHFQKRQETEVAEKAEVLLPSGAFCQDCKGPFDDGLALKKVFGGHRHEFVIGGEVVLEVDHVAFEIVGVAEKYEFHCFSWLDLMVLVSKLAFFGGFCGILGCVCKGANLKIIAFYKKFTIWVDFSRFLAFKRVWGFLNGLDIANSLILNELCVF